MTQMRFRKALAWPLAFAMKMTLKAKPFSAWLGRVLSRFPAVHEGVIRLAQRVGAVPDPQVTDQRTARVMERTFDDLPVRAQGIHRRLKAAIQEKSGQGTR